MNECYPEPSEIYSLYKALESANVTSLKLEWTCPGRRELTPDDSQVSQSTTNELCDIAEYDRLVHILTDSFTKL